jgi:hypothetical protein
MAVSTEARGAPRPGRPSTPMSAPRGLMLQAANHAVLAELAAGIDTNSRQLHGQKVSYGNCRDEMC